VYNPDLSAFKVVIEAMVVVGLNLLLLNRVIVEVEVALRTCQPVDTMRSKELFNSRHYT